MEAGYGSHMKMWTEQEDKLLLYYREKKDLDWDEIATKIPDRNRKMCYSRYKRLKYNTNPIWRQKDEQKLLELFEEHGENWETIGKHLKRKFIQSQSGTPNRSGITTSTTCGRVWWPPTGLWTRTSSSSVSSTNMARTGPRPNG